MLPSNTIKHDNRNFTMKLTRRIFVKLAAATVATPLFVPKSAFAADNRVGIAMIGAGLRGSHLAQFFSRDKRNRILYVADPDIDRAEILAADLEKRTGYRPEAIVDFRKALDDKAVDGICCASTNHWHALTALWGLRAGKHCYMEKPITHNLYESKVVVAAAEKSGLVFQSGTQRRSTTNVNELVDFLRNGGIGEVKLARLVCCRPRKAIGPLGDYPIPKSVDYDFWSGPAPIEPLTRKEFHYDWHWQRLYGNGDLGNQCPHQLDICHWALGLKGLPENVLTYGGRLGYDIETKNPDYRDAGDVANESVTMYNFGDKTIVCQVRGLPSPTVALPAGRMSTKIGILFYGTEGYAVQAPSGRGDLYSVSSICDLDGRIVREFRSLQPDGKPVPPHDSTGRHVANFLDAILANDPKAATADARCGAVSADLAHLGNISYYVGEQNKISKDELKRFVRNFRSADDNEKTLESALTHLETNGVDLKRTPLSLGAVLKIDVENETVVGNDDAAKWTTREYRKPYVVS